MSLVSYVIFWLADVAQPGFISRYFSVHVFLLASVVFGLLWASVLERVRVKADVPGGRGAFCGLVLAVLTWGLAQDLGVYRVPLSLVSFFTPTILYTLIRQ